MVRTKADAGQKVTAAKAPRKGLAPSSSGGSSSSVGSCSNSKDKYSGGNMLNAQPTPEWQKGITSFFKKQEPSLSPNKDDMDCSTIEDETSSISNSVSGEAKLSSSSKNNDSVVQESSENKENRKAEFESNGMISDDDD